MGADSHRITAGWHGRIAMVAIAGVVVLGVLAGSGSASGLAMALQGTVTIAISPSSRTVTVGEIFTLDIRIDAGGQPVDTAAAFIDFNPVYLIVVDANGNPVSEITPGSALSTVLQNSVDNNAGRIDYTAGLLTGIPPSGSFTLATIRFKAKAQTTGGGTPITFGFSPPARNTDVLYQGTSVLGAHVNGNVTISAAPTDTPTPTATRTRTPTPTQTTTPTPSPTPTRPRSLFYLPVLLKNYTPGGQPTATRTPTATLATGSICVLAYNDLNGNSLRDQGEPLIAGATVTVATSGGTLVGVRITDGTEPYCFTGLAPGAYTVQEQNPPGYVSTTWDTWGVTVDAGYSTVVEFGDRVSPTSTSTATPSRTPTATPTRTPTATPTATATPTGPPPLVVNSTNDVNDGACNAAHCSLREAINAANAHAGPDTITFNIPTSDTGCDASGVCNIRPTSLLPFLADNGTTINGYSQPGASSGANPILKIVLDGYNNGSFSGLSVQSANNVIRGLVIQRFTPFSGIHIWGATATSNHVEGNFLGTDVTGTQSRGNCTPPTSCAAIWIYDGAQANVIGPDNLIAFNGQGVWITDTGTRGNTITRNRVHSNQLKGIRLVEGGNDELAAPVITTASATQVSGTACANCTVEVFSDAADEGATYEGSTTANAAGNWTFSKPGGLTGPYVTATATDGQGNTSEFSAPASVSQAPTASPLA